MILVIVMAITKERFIKVYSNLPLGVRREIILVIDSKPVTWNAAYIEVSEDTKSGKEILKKNRKIRDNTRRLK